MEKDKEVKTFVVPELIEARLSEVINPNLLNQDELKDIVIKVEEDMILEKAKEIQKKRNRFKEPSFNGIF